MIPRWVIELEIKSQSFQNPFFRNCQLISSQWPQFQDKSKVSIQMFPFSKVALLYSCFRGNQLLQGRLQWIKRDRNRALNRDITMIPPRWVIELEIKNQKFSESVFQQLQISQWPQFQDKSKVSTQMFPFLKVCSFIIFLLQRKSIAARATPMTIAASLSRSLPGTGWYQQSLNF